MRKLFTEVKYSSKGSNERMKEEAVFMFFMTTEGGKYSQCISKCKTCISIMKMINMQYNIVSARTHEVESDQEDAVWKCTEAFKIIASYLCHLWLLFCRQK